MATTRDIFAMILFAITTLATTFVTNGYGNLGHNLRDNSRDNLGHNFRDNPRDNLGQNPRDNPRDNLGEPNLLSRLCPMGGLILLKFLRCFLRDILTDIL